jgi:hypothetical protein
VSNLRVPVRQRAALKFLVDLDENDFERLVQALDGDPPPTTRTELDERVRAALGAAANDEVVFLMNAALSISALRASATLDAAEIAREVSESDDLRDIPIERRPLLAKRIATLLSVASLTEIAKAANLITENPQVLTQARIISDIRPIFPDDPTQPPAAAVVIHTLEITSYNGADSASSYFALDDADLDALKSSVERAIAKSSALDETLAKAGLTRLKPLLPSVTR